MIRLEQQIRQKAEVQKKAGVELAATCQVGEREPFLFKVPFSILLLLGRYAW